MMKDRKGEKERKKIRAEKKRQEKRTEKTSVEMSQTVIELRSCSLI